MVVTSTPLYMLVRDPNCMTLLDQVGVSIFHMTSARQADFSLPFCISISVVYTCVLRLYTLVIDMHEPSQRNIQ